MRFLFVLLVCSIATLSHAAWLDGNSCVPNTLSALGALHAGKISPETFAKECQSDADTGTDFLNIIPPWKKCYPQVKLTVIYSVDDSNEDEDLKVLCAAIRTIKSQVSNKDIPLLFNHKYLWIGVYPKTGPHCCLVSFTENSDQVTFYHYQVDGEIITTLDTKTFFQSTFLVLDSGILP